jgi:hypothetical protein
MSAVGSYIVPHALDIFPTLDELEFAVFLAIKSYVQSILFPPTSQGINQSSPPISESSISTSICIAAFCRFCDILKLLLMGAKDVSGSLLVYGPDWDDDSNSQLSGDEKLLKFQSEAPEYYPSWIALECAIARNNLSTLKILLSSSHELHKLWPDENGNHNPLLFFQSFESPEILSCLLDYGFRETNAEGETVLHIVAMVHGFNHLVQLVLSHGADVNARTLSRQTSLHYLVGNYGYKDILPILEILLKYGADPNARTSFGTTALVYAKREVIIGRSKHWKSMVLSNPLKIC